MTLARAYSLLKVVSLNVYVVYAEMRLKQMPTDVWSVREKLALASSVMRSGDQNWFVV